MAASMRKAAHDIQTRRRTDDVLLSEVVDFASLLLSQAVVEGLTASGFQKPSPIQLKAIPLGRCGLDLIVQAKSGTGKTCVFATIALDSLVTENMTTQVLVLAPTREIAVQIHSVVTAIGSAMEGLECHVFIGGTPVSQDKARLKKCHIAIGSPGRIKQLIELGFLLTTSIRLFVLDEADKLLEEGSFQDQINWIYSSLPANKQMLALSATYPESLAQHLTRYMRDPTFVRLNPTDPGLIGLKQYYKVVRSHSMPHKIFEEKVQHLFELFSKIPFNQALVFSNLHTRAQHLADILTSKGLPAVCISGGLSQDQRLEAMSKLKQYQCRVLISTDLTSRGIDAEKVNLVINLDVPNDWETYMHRIGRAGRFGTHGLAVTYCCHGEEENKMMAIAQKCSLSLCCLPDPIPPGLMEEPCDWDITVENLKTGPAFEALPKLDKKRRAKTDSCGPGTCRDENPEKTIPRRAVKSSQAEQEGNAGIGKQPKKAVAVPGAPVLGATPAPEAPPSRTRRELQEALPKIPPLPSFKTKVPKPMSFEEIVADYEQFIEEGPGRSVEVIRQFTGPNNGAYASGRCEPLVLQQRGTDQPQGDRPLGRDSSPSPSRSVSPRSTPSSETSSTSDEDEGQRGDMKPLTLPEQTRCVDRHTGRPSQASSSSGSSAAWGQPSVGRFGKPTQTSAESARQHPSRPQAPPLQPRKKQSGKKPQNSSSPPKKVPNIKSGVDAAGGKRTEEDEAERSNREYWRAYYQAWEEYYTAMPQYYQMAYSWMAAYRMNSVYMRELLKR
ncbi:probable ATP-dependent RNA helicase DDX20 [Megalops cyprinoides]|uniref:probable ATP-dependent RNA helicase DDX20 n=1 Tax=Megalops cyprinoides TaxID=118141 RepID=UPI00186566E6|nr:probable ATP-dependent RNA helicase DDX20 [Megalops cyprinoides]